MAEKSSEDLYHECAQEYFSFAWTIVSGDENYSDQARQLAIQALRKAFFIFVDRDYLENAGKNEIDRTYRMVISRFLKAVKKDEIDAAFFLFLNEEAQEFATHEWYKKDYSLHDFKGDYKRFVRLRTE